MSAFAGEFIMMVQRDLPYLSDGGKALANGELLVM